MSEGQRKGNASASGSGNMPPCQSARRQKGAQDNQESNEGTCCSLSDEELRIVLSRVVDIAKVLRCMCVSRQWRRVMQKVRSGGTVLTVCI